MRLLAESRPPCEATCALLEALGEKPPQQAVSMAELVRRPSLDLTLLQPLCPALESFSPEVIRQAEILTKYAGYLARQGELVARTRKAEERLLPEDLDYSRVIGLSREIQEKLHQIRPLNFGQAGRISGVTPAALSNIAIHLRKHGA